MEKLTEYQKFIEELSLHFKNFEWQKTNDKESKSIETKGIQQTVNYRRCIINAEKWLGGCRIELAITTYTDICVTGETVDEVAEKVKLEVAEMISSLISIT